jgi:hypothetical protein
MNQTKSADMRTCASGKLKRKKEKLKEENTIEASNVAT